MPSSRMLSSVAPVRTDVSEESIIIIMVTRIGKQGKTLAVTSNQSTLRRNARKPTVLSSALDGNEWLVSRFGSFTPPVHGRFTVPVG
jgi:hypothetical protein